MLGIISGRILDIDEKLCACYSYIEKTFDSVNWTKLMQILERNSIDWGERSLTRKFYVENSVKLRLGQGGDKKCEVWQTS
jgi:hypothetical protein